MIIQLGRFGVRLPMQARQWFSCLCVLDTPRKFPFPLAGPAQKFFEDVVPNIPRPRISRCARWLHLPWTIERARFFKELKTMSSSAPGPWIRLYKSRRWERRSRRNLQAHKYLCQECLKNGKTVPATLSHHVREYQPNFTELEFWYGELSACCHDCHFKIHHPGYEIKDRGFLLDIGSDGYPIDPRHDFYNSTTAKRESQND
jgi:hypothetical protein